MSNTDSKDIRCSNEIVLDLISKKIVEYKGETNKNRAFMGLTHGLSALAVFMVIVAFAPNILNWLMKSDSLPLPVIIVFALAFVGSAFIPDFDNTKSTAESSTGLLGSVLSSIFRGSSRVIQTTIRTPRDNIEPNPHRGFWHTPLVSAPLLGLLVFLGTKVPGEISIPVIGHTTFGSLIAFFITWMLLHIALSGVLKSFMKKLKQSSSFGWLLTFVVSLSVTIVLFMNIPDDLDFWWLGVAVTLGMICHDAGDLCTTSGIPLFFPLSALFRGKFWWITRILPIKAGGVVENFVFIPFFILIIIICIIKIFIAGT